MSFSFFKPRKPGHGGAFEKKVVAAQKATNSKKFPSKDNSFNSKDKKAV